MPAPISWRILPGLAGEGPLPFHFHKGHPTPWSEGRAVEFRLADGSKWVGNFQGGSESLIDVVLWPEANVIVALVNGDLYFVPFDDPLYFTAHPSESVSAVWLVIEENLLLVSDWCCLYACRRDLKVAWTYLGGTSFKIRSCENGTVNLTVTGDVDEPDLQVALNLDGSTRKI